MYVSRVGRWQELHAGLSHCRCITVVSTVNTLISSSSNVKYRAPGLESGPRESQRLEPMTSHSEGMIVYIRGPMLNNGRFPPNHA